MNSSTRKEDIPRGRRPTTVSVLKIVLFGNILLGYCGLSWFYHHHVSNHPGIDDTMTTDEVIKLWDQPDLRWKQIYPMHKKNHSYRLHQLLAERKRLEKLFNNMTTERFRCMMNNGSKLDTPVFPHLIIAGAQKAGTSAISKYLSRVPDLLPANTLEPHFFSYRIPRTRNNQTGNVTFSFTRSLRHRCSAIGRYLSNFNASRIIEGKTIVYEKTPILLAIPTVPHTILEVLDPHRPKILLILRDPVDRLDSSYRMYIRPNISAVKKRDKWQVNKTTGMIQVRLKDLSIPSLTKYIEDEILDFHAKGLLEDFPLLSDFYNSTTNINQNNTSSSGGGEEVVVLAPPSPSPSQAREINLFNYSQPVARGFYAKQLEPFLKYFPLGSHLKVIRYETFLENKANVLDEILQFVGSTHTPFPWQEEEMDEYLGPHKKELHPKVVEAVRMPNTTRMYLKALYRPFNDELATLLGDEWKDVWK